MGNYYSTLWEDSVAVAAELASAGRLAAVAADINAHHTVLLGPPAASGLPANPMPDWLKDVLLNQFSHFRSMHWTVDGRSVGGKVSVASPPAPTSLSTGLTLPAPTPRPPPPPPTRPPRQQDEGVRGQ